MVVAANAASLSGQATVSRKVAHFGELGHSWSMAKTPSTSRKSLSPSVAPYRKTAALPVPVPVPLPAPAPTPEPDPPAVLLAPTDIVPADPTAPDAPPGRVPPGDSRSLRHGDSFALVYRHGISLISRTGRVGQHGSWKIIDYPSPLQAAAAYAAECSRLLALGYADHTK